jgi:hypothetical protein
MLNAPLNKGIQFSGTPFKRTLSGVFVCESSLGRKMNPAQKPRLPLSARNILFSLEL